MSTSGRDPPNSWSVDIRVAMTQVLDELYNLLTAIQNIAPAAFLCIQIPSDMPIQSSSAFLSKHPLTSHRQGIRCYSTHPLRRQLQRDSQHLPSDLRLLLLQLSPSLAVH